MESTTYYNLLLSQTHTYTDTHMEGEYYKTLTTVKSRQWVLSLPCLQYLCIFEIFILKKLGGEDTGLKKFIQDFQPLHNKNPHKVYIIFILSIIFHSRNPYQLTFF